jgi:hypothetical protein
MKNLIVVSVVSAALAGVAVAAAPASKDVRIPMASLPWTKPMGPDGPEMAYVSGDPKTGPFQMFLRMKANQAAGWHTHDADYTAVVMQGTWMHLVQGETTAQALPAGSFWSQVGKGNHDDRCGADGPCTVFIVSAGAQTFHPKTADGKDVPAPAKK